MDKRVDRLLDAWKIVCEELSDWKLLIVGDGDEANRLKAMSANCLMYVLRVFETIQNPIIKVPLPYV